MTSPETPTPTDQQLLAAVMNLRQLQPHLGRAKFLILLKERYSWVLSETRLKKMMDLHGLNAEPEAEVTNLDRGSVFQAIVKEAFEDYKVRERNFYLTLPPYQQRELAPAQSPTPQTYAACHLRHHVEFLFTLKELKPCVLFSGCSHNPEIFGQLVQDCLMPVMRKYKLERYGFVLAQITHSMPTTSTPRNFRGSWVFADTRSPYWPEAKRMFFVRGGKTNEKRLGVILGYPTADGTKYFRGVDYTEMEELKQATPYSVCCVTAYGFGVPSGPEHFQDIMDHYYRCRDVAQEVGVYVRQDLQRHTELMKYWDAIFMGPKEAARRAKHFRKD